MSATTQAATKPPTSAVPKPGNGRRRASPAERAISLPDLVAADRIDNVDSTLLDIRRRQTDAPSAINATPR
ncbi:hypothetical protein [Streptomyces sp. NPDC056242]|uniref:hypothetical protein n=1 Tax=Streptomyces sp. NPDC056242 TaxID=3345760 RepID=UPI0035D97DD3